MRMLITAGSTVVALMNFRNIRRRNPGGYF